MVVGVAMNKLLVGCAALLAVCATTGARAADVPVAPYQAPPPVFYNWGGCYLGVVAGYAWGTARVDERDTGPTRTGDFDVSGGQVGGTGGCNMLVSGLVFG